MANKNFTVKNGLEVGGQEVISSSGAITSAALGGQVLGTSASPSFANITTAGYLRGPASFVIDPAAHGDDTGTVVIAGNLQVDGTQTTINSTTMTVDDLNLTLASGAANAAAANGAGINVDIAGATNPSLVYGSSNDDWTFNKDLNVTGNGALSGNLDVVGQIGAYDNPGSACGKMILRATDFEFKNAGGTIIGSFDTNNHLRIVNDLQMDSSSPRLDYDNGDSNGSFRLFSTSSNAATHQFYPNGHAHFITTAGTFKIEGLGSTSNQIESGGSLKVRSVSGHVDLLDGTTEVLNTTTTGVRLPLNLVVDGKLGINENSLSSNARLQVRYDNSQSYSAYNALTNPSMIIKNLTSGASKFASLGFITESNGEGAISLVQGSGNINADMTFSVRSSGTRAEHMRITHDGKVGIGTDTPAFRLHTYHPTTNVVARFESGDAEVWLDLHDTNSGSYGVLLGHDGAAGDLFKVANASVDTKFVIKNNGDVGIGTTDTYSRKFVVEGAGDLMMLRSTNAGAGGAQLDLIHDSASAADGDSVGIVNFSSDTMQYASIKGVSSNVGNEGEFHIGIRESSSTYNHDAIVVTKDANVRIGGRTHIGSDVIDTRLTLGSTGTENTNSSSNIRSVSGNVMYNAGSSSHIWELAGTPKMNLGTNGRLTFVGGSNTEGISLGANHRIYGGANRLLEASTSATGQISLGEGYSDGSVKVFSKFVLGTFPQSTTNTGEAWIGRAADRQDGTMTVQLGGNDHTGTKFEIVDRAWSKVMYSFAGEAPGGTISTQSQGYMHVGSQQNTAFLYLGSQGGAFGGNSSNWLRASGTNFMLNAAGGNFLFEIGGSQKGYINSSGFNNGSDVALKENIEDIEYGINTVNQLRPRKFDRIDAPDADKAEVGFIAQEVESIIPELISNSKPEGAEGQITKGMNYGALTSVLVKAIQEQQVIIDDLKSRIEALEG